MTLARRMGLRAPRWRCSWSGVHGADPRGLRAAGGDRPRGALEGRHGPSLQLERLVSDIESSLQLHRHGQQPVARRVPGREQEAAGAAPLARTARRGRPRPERPRPRDRESSPRVRLLLRRRADPDPPRGARYHRGRLHGRADEQDLHGRDRTAVRRLPERREQAGGGGGRGCRRADEPRRPRRRRRRRCVDGPDRPLRDRARPLDRRPGAGRRTAPAGSPAASSPTGCRARPGRGRRTDPGVQRDGRAARGQPRGARAAKRGAAGERTRED